MTLLINCPTPKALLIAPLKDERGVLHLPVEKGELPGITLDVKASMGINEQLLQLIEERFGVAPAHKYFSIEQDLTLTMSLNDGDAVTAYLALHNGEGVTNAGEYPVFMDVLRHYPANKNRKTLFKAFQYFASGLSENLAAIASDDLMEETDV